MTDIRVNPNGFSRQNFIENELSEQKDIVEATIWLFSGVRAASEAAIFALSTFGCGAISIFSAGSLLKLTLEKPNRQSSDDALSLALITTISLIGMAVTSRLYQAEVNIAKKSFKHFNECL